MPKVSTKNGVTVTDHSKDVQALYERAREVALEKIGMKAEGYAKKLCPVGRLYGGTLRNSITHNVDGRFVYIGTNVHYAPYVELGTGIHAEKGDGRKTPWVYKGRDGFVFTRGMRPKPYLRPAATDHKETYKGIITKTFKEIAGK